MWITRIYRLFKKAPEVLQGLKYDTKADVFSAGVILYILLSGKHPFKGTKLKATLDLNKKGIADFCNKKWSEISLLGKELCQKMLNVDPNKRITIEEALQDRFFQIPSVGILPVLRSDNSLKPDEYNSLVEVLVKKKKKSLQKKI